MTQECWGAIIDKNGLETFLSVSLLKVNYFSVHGKVLDALNDKERDNLMNYSYVMGIGASINELKEKGFVIENDGDNFMVSFPKEKADLWERFVSQNLEDGYWNEYITGYGVVFLFNLEGRIKKYTIYNYYNEEVLKLCEKLCECKFKSIKDMLADNRFYKDKLK